MFAANEDKQERTADAMRQMIRVGEVVSTDPATVKARVKFADADGLVSRDLPVIVPKSHKDKAYFMPDVGEHVLCLFMPNGLEQGFILGAFYSKADPAPVSSQDKWHVAFEDGTKIEYNRSAGKLLIDCVGEIEIKAAGNIKINGARIDLN